MGVGWPPLGSRLTALLTTTAVLALVGCGGGGGGGARVALVAGCRPVEAPAPKQVDLARPPARERLTGPATAVVATSCGSFEIALDTARAPRTTSSFAYLARHGVYDETRIHRISHTYIQGGDPLGNGTGGPGYFIDEPPPQNLSYTRGVVAMAKTAVEPPGRSGSQFFVVIAADAGLSPDYALLGRVTRGFAVLQRIEGLGTPSGRPRAAVVIDHVSVRSG
jgi:peptidyl-prolyl cis-trans isomerase B (cyclophilin B)